MGAPAGGASPGGRHDALPRLGAPRAGGGGGARRRARGARRRGAGASSRGWRAAAAGDDYRYVLDGGDPLPDPCSRFQPEGVRGPSRVVDTGAVRVDRRRLGRTRPRPTWSSTSSTWAPSRPRAPSRRPPRACGELRDLGVTAVELMPLATFPGERNWGYDGLYTWAPAPGLRRARGPRRLRRRRPRARPRGDPGRRLQPRRARVRGPRRLRALLHRPLRHALGPGDELRRRRLRRRARVGAPERAACGCASTAWTGCGWTPCTRSTTWGRGTCWPSWPTGRGTRRRGRRC